MKKIKVILIGAGNRGKGYTKTMLNMPDKYEVVAVAEPNESFREFIRERHAIPLKCASRAGSRFYSLERLRIWQ